MKKTIGILAHVDAGKTTFSEQLLYYTGSIRTLGRVDHKTSHMDTNEIEQTKGITIFADQCSFTYKEDTYYLIDTPGHVDFSTETERIIKVLDYAILLISGTSGVQAHTNTLFKLLKSYKIPTFIFINKSDVQSFSLEGILKDIKNKLTKDILYINSYKDIIELNVELVEFAAERDEEFLEIYLNDNYSVDNLKKVLKDLIKRQSCFPVMKGSALKGKGIENFWKFFQCFQKLIIKNQRKILL
ncbi:GTP-binding protein [Defluviitalea phaphyphila]|uniref:GTP-binding protein n=1 Tax=Defluviitalea phaphyphila TaxID=1473580 RepID=UPI000B32664A|nr:GTP-binding protein [Defluviitalea phaphyphila]